MPNFDSNLSSSFNKTSSASSPTPANSPGGKGSSAQPNVQQAAKAVITASAATAAAGGVQNFSATPLPPTQAASVAAAAATMFPSTPVSSKIKDLVKEMEAEFRGFNKLTSGQYNKKVEFALEKVKNLSREETEQLIQEADKVILDGFPMVGVKGKLADKMRSNCASKQPEKQQSQQTAQAASATAAAAAGSPNIKELANQIKTAFEVELRDPWHQKVDFVKQLVRKCNLSLEETEKLIVEASTWKIKERSIIDPEGRMAEKIKTGIFGYMALLPNKERGEEGSRVCKDLENFFQGRPEGASEVIDLLDKSEKNIEGFKRALNALRSGSGKNVYNIIELFRAYPIGQRNTKNLEKCLKEAKF